MKLLVDDANIELIKRAYEYYSIDGVTTNPSILSRVGGNPFEVLKEIRQFIGEDAELHVQTLEQNASGMAEEAKRIIKELGLNTYIKIPAVPEGFKAMKMLKDLNIHITATAIYTPLQAFLAAKCGANYVAPYINRIDNMGYRGLEVAKTIRDIFKEHGLHTKIIAANFKNSQQVLELCSYGIDSATATLEVIDGFVENPAIDFVIQKFVSDFEMAYGNGKTMNSF